MEEQTAIAVEELIQKLNEKGEKVIFLVTVYLCMREQLKKDLRYRLHFLQHESPERLGALGIEYFKQGKTETAREHQPDYLRVSQAESGTREKKQRNQRTHDSFAGNGRKRQ